VRTNPGQESESKMTSIEESKTGNSFEEPSIIQKEALDGQI